MCPSDILMFAPFSHSCAGDSAFAELLCPLKHATAQAREVSWVGKHSAEETFFRLEIPPCRISKTPSPQGSLSGGTMVILTMPAYLLISQRYRCPCSNVISLVGGRASVWHTIAEPCAT